MSAYFELIAPPQGRAQFALFDFDGTISLIRAGWQQVMTPYFTEILMQCPGAYFGVGAGEDYPALHTPEFKYRDELIEYTVSMFENIAAL